MARAVRAANLPGAALVLSGVLLALALPRAPSSPVLCDRPSELQAKEGWTSAVVCIAPAADRREEPVPLRGPARLLFGSALDANRASARALEVLSGIGPVRAAAIVREREKRPFASFADLERVHGVGPRTVERLAGQLEVLPAGAREGRAGPGVRVPDGPPGGRQGAEGRGSL